LKSKSKNYIKKIGELEKENKTCKKSLEEKQKELESYKIQTTEHKLKLEEQISKLKQEVNYHINRNQQISQNFQENSEMHKAELETYQQQVKLLEKNMNDCQVSLMELGRQKARVMEENIFIKQEINRLKFESETDRKRILEEKELQRKMMIEIENKNKLLRELEWKIQEETRYYDQQIGRLKIELEKEQKTISDYKENHQRRTISENEKHTKFVEELIEELRVHQEMAELYRQVINERDEKIQQLCQNK